jgi:hypothetical protein
MILLHDKRDTPTNWNRAKEIATALYTRTEWKRINEEILFVERPRKHYKVDVLTTAIMEVLNDNEWRITKKEGKQK